MNNTAMNPFSNRWVLLFVVAGFLLLVTELVGTGEKGGVLSQLAGTKATAEESGPSTGEPIEVIGPTPAVEDAEEEPEEVLEEDTPQIIAAEDLEDAGEFSPDEGGDQTGAIEESIEEEPIEDEPIDDEPIE